MMHTKTTVLFSKTLNLKRSSLAMVHMLSKLNTLDSSVSANNANSDMFARPLLHKSAV